MQTLINKLIEPRRQISEKQKLFSNQALKLLIVPLFFEQLLEVFVGIADTFMGSYAGEAAVSGVSLVNMFNTVFIYLFAALASGGAVVVSQYIGNKDQENGNLAASQFLMIASVFSIALMILVLASDQFLLRLLFGEVEAEVMEACITYLQISAYSFPAIAIYNAGAAIYRSMGKTKATMVISIIANLINIIGNALGVFVFHAGVAGVAYPSLISRSFAAISIVLLCTQKQNIVFIKMKQFFCWKGAMLRRILGIAVPNGIENGLFQLVKVALSSITALFGTVQIAANGVAQSFWSLAALMGTAMGLAFVTVIGQCMGANDSEAADYYMRKLLRITVVASLLWNGAILLVSPLVLKGYAISAQAAQLVLVLILIHNLFNAFLYPFSGALANGLRASGDVRYTMVVSLVSTLFCRVLFSVILAITLNWGVIGVALAMCMDWSLRACLFWRRFQGGKWKNFNVIG